jgi:hypothetical protein
MSAVQWLLVVLTAFIAGAGFGMRWLPHVPRGGEG